MIENIKRSTHSLISFFEKNAEAKIYCFPFHSSYPKNCCESASVIFRTLLRCKYPESYLRVIGGTSTDFEQHFWLEVDGLTFDLTAHQFEGIERPIVGENFNPVAKKFKPDGSKLLGDLVDEKEIISLHQCNAFGF